MYFWGGRPFLTGAVSELRARTARNDAADRAWRSPSRSSSSWGASLGMLDHELDFWWELALLIVIMLLGHWIEMRSLAQTTSALDSLAALLPDEAERVEGDDGRHRSPRPTCGVGDVVIVRPGGRVPADGEVVEGTADMDESMITGESRPVRRGVGDARRGRHRRHRLRRCASGHRGRRRHRAGRHPAAGRPRRRTPRRGRSASPTRAAGWLFWFALGAGVLTAIVWTLLGSPDDAVDPHHHRAGDRLPARPRPGDSAGGLDRHRTRGPRRRAGQGPARAGEHAHRRHRAVRQDRHPDQGRAGRDRASHAVGRARPRTRCSRWRPPPRPTASIRWPGRSSQRPRRRGLTVPAATGLPSSHRGRA